MPATSRTSPYSGLNRITRAIDSREIQTRHRNPGVLAKNTLKHPHSAPRNGVEGGETTLKPSGTATPQSEH